RRGRPEAPPQVPPVPHRTRPEGAPRSLPPRVEALTARRLGGTSDVESGGRSTRRRRNEVERDTGCTTRQTGEPHALRDPHAGRYPPRQRRGQLRDVQPPGQTPGPQRTHVVRDRTEIAVPESAQQSPGRGSDDEGGRERQLRRERFHHQVPDGAVPVP